MKKHLYALMLKLKQFQRSRKALKITFIFSGLLSTFWFLIRVIPKPSRAAYPCMKAAAPFMSGFILYILSIGSTVLVLKRARRYLYRSRYLMFALALVAGLILSLSTLVLNRHKAYAITNAVLENPNQPMGKGVGINPGRVVWIHAPDATNEDCTNQYPDFWSDDSNTNQGVVNQMVSKALQELSSQPTNEEAWDAIFKYHNANHDKGEIGYKAGEKIVIKLNMNTASRSESPTRPDYRTVDTSPQLAYAVLSQLINTVGVDPSDISIGDPGRTIDNIYWERCHADFPEVHYWGTAPGRTPIVKSDEKVFFSSDGSLSEYLPKSYVEAEYMINIPVLKKHHRGGVSLSSKNHFGTFVPFSGSASHLHFSLPCPDGKADVSNGDYGSYRIFVDFMGHKDLGGKTILYLLDGLWTTTNWAHPPIKWELAPFNNDYPSSLFASQDPVAIESVGYDFLREEFDTDHPTEGAYDPTDNTGPFPQYAGVDDFLHQAADSAYWPEGLRYDPENDGSVLPGSMGTHEHWNNAEEKQYTRNLGGDKGIELLYTLIAGSPVHVDQPEKNLSNGVLTLRQNYPNPIYTTTVISYTLSSPARVQMSVIDISGKLVEVLVQENQQSGDYKLDWNASDSHGIALGSGIYYLHMEAETIGQVFTQTRKLVVAR